MWQPRVLYNNSDRFLLSRAVVGSLAMQVTVVATLSLYDPNARYGICLSSFPWPGGFLREPIRPENNHGDCSAGLDHGRRSSGLRGMTISLVAAFDTAYQLV